MGLKVAGKKFGTMSFASDESFSSKNEEMSLGGGERLYLAQTVYPHHGQNKSQYILASVQNKVVKKLKSGQACGDWVEISDGSTGLSLICKDLSKQFPKGIEASSDGIKMHFWSSLGGMRLDFKMPTLVEFWDLEGWAKALKREDAVPNVLKLKTNALGYSKTHEVLIYPRSVKTSPSPTTLAQAFREGIYASSDPRWIYKTRAVPFFYPKDENNFPEAEGFISAFFDNIAAFISGWGSYGFLYYGQYPFMYRYVDGKLYGDFFRYNYTDYTLKDSVWYLYLRSGERKYRRFAEFYSRHYMDGAFLHDESAGVPGSYRQIKEVASKKDISPFDLPMPWDHAVSKEVNLDNQSSSTLNYLFYYYYSNGDRRAYDVAMMYKSAAEKKFAEKGDVMTGSCPVRGVMRHVAQLYGYTWDDKINKVAENATGRAMDLDVSTGISFNFRDQLSYGAFYKTQVMITGIMDYYLATGDEKAKSVILKNANFRMDADDSTPLFYNNSVGMLYNLAYKLTGDWKYVGAARLYFDRGVFLEYDAKKKELIKKSSLGLNHLSRYVFQSMPAMMDLFMTAKNEGKWFPRLDQSWSGCKTEFVFKKEKNKEVWFDLWSSEELVKRVKCVEGKNKDFRVEYDGVEDATGSVFTLKLPKEVGRQEGGKYMFSASPLQEVTTLLQKRGGNENDGEEFSESHLALEKTKGANLRKGQYPSSSAHKAAVQVVKDSLVFEKIPQETLTLNLKTDKPLLLFNRFFPPDIGKTKIKFSGNEGNSNYFKSRYKIVVEAGSDAGEYVFRPNESGAIWSVLDDNVDKMVLHLPEGAYLDGRMPVGKRPLWYFYVPKEGNPEIFLNRRVFLFDPSEERHEMGDTKGRWYNLPKKDGIWAIEPNDLTYVKFRGIPPFMTKGDKNRFFIPKNIKKETVAQDFKPDNRVPFQKGMFGEAWLLSGKSMLNIPLGGEKGERDYEYFHAQEGTLEFWFRPNWSSLELEPSEKGLSFLSNPGAKFKLSYQYNPSSLNEASRSSLFSYITGDGVNLQGAFKPVGLRDYRSTLFNAGQWYHVAVVWYSPYSNKDRTEKTLQIFSYVDGKRGQYFDHTSVLKNYKVVKIESPLMLRGGMNGLIDELRISDIPRYKNDFIPQRTEFTLDANTLMLIHFNGDLKALTTGGNIVQLGE